MKNTKRIWLALLLCMALCLTFFAVACDNGTANPGENTDDPNAGNTTPPVQGENNNPGGEDEPQTPTTFEYTVIVKDQDGNPVADVAAQVCVGDSCLMPNVTNDQGKVVFKLSSDPGDAVVALQILGADSPAGYTYPEGKQPFEAGKNEITITVTKAN